MINPFMTSSSSNNTFTSNLYSNNKTNDFFKINNNNNNFTQSSSNTYNPFKVNNNNNISSNNNNNDIFSRINTNISDNTSNNNIFMNNMNSPFRTGNTTNTNMFNNNTNMFNNGSNFSFQNQNTPNMPKMKEYNFGYNHQAILPICETVGKNPLTSFDHNIRYQKEYAEKNKMGQMEYSKAMLEYISNDDNLKNYSIEEIRVNDYLNGKIQFYDKWSNDNYNPNKKDNNQTNYSGMNNFMNNNLNNNNNNTYSIFNQNNYNNGNNTTNPFINNNNNNNPFNNNNNGNTNYNPFNNNNNNNNKLNFLNNNNNNMFNNNINNNMNNNPFANSSNKNIFNTNNNIFNNTTNNSPFNSNNNFLNNNNNNNPFNNNNNNTNNIFNRNNNIFNNNSSNNIFNNNNNNIFNNNNQNPFNSVLNKNINMSTNTNYFNNNNNLVNNIFNNNTNNFMEKPFEEKIKDPTWVKRNVRLISNNDLDNWFSDYLDEISKINLKVKEMQYFSDKNDTKINSEEEMSNKENLIFNKIILSTDEEILKYNIEKEKSERNLEKNTRNYNEDEKNMDTEYENLYKEEKRWDPIYIKNNNSNEILENIYTLKNENLKNNNYKNNKGKISGFTEASKILSNFDDDYVDFNLNNKEPKEFILPTEKNNFVKFNNNMMNNRQSYMSPSVNFKYNIYNNNNNTNLDMDLNSINSNNYYHASNGYNYQNNNINVFENKDSVKNENLIKNNIINNTNSNKTTKINTDEINRNLIIMEENNNKEEEEEKNDINQNECKLIYLGESGNIEELKIPIIIQFSSLILPNENLLNFDSIIDIIIKNIKSIENIQDKILLPKKEDIYLKLDGKIYSKLTTTEININQVDKYVDNENNYYYIYYGFKLKQYPLLINDINDLGNIYITNPKLEDILNPSNNYNLKKIENFQIWNKYGKIIFLDPIDLSGKIIINDIIKINEGDIDLTHKRVDKLKARAFLYYDFGDKLEGTFLENIKYMLKNDKGNFVKYENKILEYTINC